MKKNFLAILFALIGISAYAQQQPIFTQSMQNTMLINPAAMGVKQFLDAKVGYRKQWADIPNSPSSFYATLQTPLGYNYSKAHLSTGGFFMTDMAGNIRQTTVQVVGAYHLLISNQKQKSMLLSFGLAPGMTNYSIDQSNVVVQNNNDPIANAAFSRTKFALDFGVRLSGRRGSSEVYFVGLSANLPRNYESQFNGQMNRIASNITLSGGIALAVPNLRNVAFVPSFILRRNTFGTQIDLNGTLKVANKFWAGVNYRHNQAIGFLLGGFFTENLNATISYEMPNGNQIGKLATRALGTSIYEISIGFRRPNGKGSRWSINDLPNVDN